MKSLFTFTPKTLPPAFKALDCPWFQPASVGPWTIFQAPGCQELVAAYFTNGARLPDKYWVLTRKNRVWMSLTPVELQSQGYHARLASGNVLVMGLGMGAVVFNLLRNPKVSHITVCEREREVVTVLTQAAPWFAAAVKSGKVTLNICCALAFKPAADQKFETLLVDIWTALGQSWAESDVVAMQKRVGAGQVGWWGQELSLVGWVYENYDDGNRMPFRRDHAQAYEKHLGFRILGSQHPNYPSLLLAAATNVAAVMVHKSQPRLGVKDDAVGTGGIRCVTTQPDTGIGEDSKGQSLGGRIATFFRGFFGCI
jgi:hypothetical protein